MDVSALHPIPKLLENKNLEITKAVYIHKVALIHAINFRQVS